MSEFVQVGDCVYLSDETRVLGTTTTDEVTAFESHFDDFAMQAVFLIQTQGTWTHQLARKDTKDYADAA